MLAGAPVEPLARRIPQCPRCGHRRSYAITDRRLEQCPRCRYQASITAGTVFHRTRIPLRLWFLGIFFLASDKQEILALQFERDMGLGSHQTAWTLRHKLRSALWHRPEHRLRAGGGRREARGRGKEKGLRWPEGTRCRFPRTESRFVVHKCTAKAATPRMPRVQRSARSGIRSPFVERRCDGWQVEMAVRGCLQCGRSAVRQTGRGRLRARLPRAVLRRRSLVGRCRGLSRLGTPLLGSDMKHLRATAGRASLQTQTLWWIAAVAVSGLMLLWRLGGYPLVQPDEGRNAEIAREMEVSGSWLIPTLNGIPYLDKPALYFKSVGLSMDLLGNSEWAARLPSALFGLATLGLVFAICKREYTTARAATAVIIVATSPLYVMYSRLVIFDMALTFFVTAAVLAGFCAEMFPGFVRWRWHAAGAAAAGLGTLVKGPVGFVEPTLVLIVFFLLERRRDALRRLFAPLNLLIFSAIVLPWFVGVTYRFPDFPYYGVVQESILRYMTDEFNRNQPVYFYPVVLVAGFFPWSLLLLDSLSRAWRAYTRLASLERISLLWIAVIVVFFSLSHSKLPGYLLVVVAPVALLASRCFDSTSNEPSFGAPTLIRRTSLALAILCVGSAAAFALAVVGLRHQAAQLDTMLIEELTQRWVFIAGALGLLAILAMGAWRTESARAALVAFAALPLLLMIVGFGPWVREAERRSARSLATAVDSRAAGAEIVCVRCFPTSLPFYLGRTITVVSEIGNEITSNYIPFALERGAAWPRGLIRGRDLNARVASRRQPLFLLADDSLAQDSGRPELEALARAYDARVEAVAPGYVGVLLPSGSTP